MDELRAGHAGQPNVRVWPEMSVGLGASRVDVGLINGAISGYEIKSDHDNLGRLPSQIEHYSRCLDFATIVVGTRHLKAVRAIIPRWWGITVAQAAGTGGVELASKRQARPNPRLDPFYVAQMLWRDEAMSVLKARGLHHGLSKATRWELWDALAEIPVVELQHEVRRALTERPSTAVA